MTLKRWLRRNLLLTLSTLYSSGVAVFVLQRWFLFDTGFGIGPRPQAAILLHVHGIVGLWFMVLFGYLWRSHIEPGLKQKRRRVSGISLLVFIAILLGTVPGLYYLGDEFFKDQIAWLHTYLGLVSVAPFLIHWTRKVLR